MSINKTFSLPMKEKLVDDDGKVNDKWFWFFKGLEKNVYNLGEEKSFTLVNGQSSAADITYLKFDYSNVTCSFFEYLVQRITTSTGAVELTEVGSLIFVYNPTSQTWSKVTVSEENPDDAGVTFSITSAGQVQYTTTNEGGTASISTLWYRSRVLEGKNSNYSTFNR